MCVCVYARARVYVLIKNNCMTLMILFLQIHKNFETSSSVEIK